MWKWAPMVLHETKHRNKYDLFEKKNTSWILTNWLILASSHYNKKNVVLSSSLSLSLPDREPFTYRETKFWIIQPVWRMAANFFLRSFQVGKDEDLFSFLQKTKHKNVDWRKKHTQALLTRILPDQVINTSINLICSVSLHIIIF